MIGAGRGQIPVIDLCHKYGRYVIVVSPNGNYPGLQVADEVIYEDVKNQDIIFEKIKDKNISAVLSDQLDEGVTTAAYIAEKLNIKGISYNTALKFTNKFVMREEAEKAGISVPKYTMIKNISEIKEALSGFEFPLVMKPVDSAASRGVYKVNSIDEIIKKFEESKCYSKDGAVIIEEFICGKEFVVEAYTEDYNVKNLIVGHRDYFDIDGVFIPNATVFTDANSPESEIEKRIMQNNKKLVEKMGLSFGITHGEYLYNEKNDKIYLVEIAARGGGVFISSDLIPAACGVNINDRYVKNVLGIEDDVEIILQKGASAYFCYLTPEGTVTSIKDADQIENVPGVIKAFFDNIELGMKTASIRDKSSRKGPILVKGRNKKDCYSVIEQVKKVLKIQVKTSNGEESVIWQ